jgi:hypothetical protein
MYFNTPNSVATAAMQTTDRCIRYSMAKV